METSNRFIITINSSAMRDAQLYVGASSTPWNDEDDDNWGDFDIVTPLLDTCYAESEPEKEAIRKKYAAMYGCEANFISLVPMEVANDKILSLAMAHKGNAGDITRLILSEAEGNNSSFAKTGKDIIEAIAYNDANKLLVALTGWSAKDLLVRAGALPDTEEVSSCQEPATETL